MTRRSSAKMTGNDKRRNDRRFVIVGLDPTISALVSLAHLDPTICYSLVKSSYASSEFFAFRSFSLSSFSFNLELKKLKVCR